jgi:hypothetical protein
MNTKIYRNVRISNVIVPILEHKMNQNINVLKLELLFSEIVTLPGLFDSEAI